MRWVRLNIDFDDSPWLFVLSAESQLAWVKLICHVKRDGMNGRCKALSPIVAGKKWGVGDESVTKLLQAAVIDKAIIIDDGYWELANWSEYQQSDSTAAERMRRMREKNSEIEPVTRNNRNKGRNLSRDIDNDIDKDNKKKASPSSARMDVPPSLDDVVAYMKERKFAEPEIEAESFLAYYDSVGWVIGKSRTPVKDWKGCVRTFEARRKREGSWVEFKPKPPEPVIDVDYRLKETMGQYMKVEMDGVTPFNLNTWRKRKMGESV